MSSAAAGEPTAASSYSYDAYLSLADDLRGERTGDDARHAVAKLQGALSERGVLTVTSASSSCKATARSLVDASGRFVAVVTRLYAERLAAAADQRGGAADLCALEFAYAARRFPQAMVFAVLEPGMADSEAWPEPLRSALGSQPFVNLGDNPSGAFSVDALVAAMLRAAPTQPEPPKPPASRPPHRSGTSDSLIDRPLSRPATPSSPAADETVIISAEADAFLRGVCKVPSSMVRSLQRQGVRSAEHLALVTPCVLRQAGFAEMDIVFFEEKRPLLPGGDRKASAAVPSATTAATSSTSAQTMAVGGGDDEQVADSCPRELSSLREAEGVLLRRESRTVRALQAACGVVAAATAGSAAERLESDAARRLLAGLTAALRAHGASDAALAAAACGAIRNLCARDDAQAEARSLGTLPQLQGVLRAHGASSAAVAELACAAVWNVCVDGANKAEAGRTGLLAELQGVLRAHGASSAAVAEQACGAVRNICIHEPNRAEAGRLGLLAELQGVLRAHGASQPGVTRRACGAVTNICLGSRANQADAQALRILRELQATRRANLALWDVQRVCKGAEAAVAGRTPML